MLLKTTLNNYSKFFSENMNGTFYFLGMLLKNFNKSLYFCYHFFSKKNLKNVPLTVDNFIKRANLSKKGVEEKKF